MDHSQENKKSGTHIFHKLNNIKFGDYY
jgi:hypothetical protein